jgi:hypothetical protein
MHIFFQDMSDTDQCLTLGFIENLDKKLWKEVKYHNFIKAKISGDTYF